MYTCPVPVCIHNSCYRNYITNGDIDIIPDIVYNMAKKNYEMPNLNEGFSEIQEINFQIHEKHKEQYSKYYF